MSDGRLQAYDQLVGELSRLVLAGAIVVGQRVEVDGASFEVEGFDPFGADGRSVYVRAANGDRFTIEVPAR